MVSKQSTKSFGNDPLQNIKRSTVAIGNFSKFASIPKNVWRSDSSNQDFDVICTGFTYCHTPLEFVKNKPKPDTKTGAIYYAATLWLVTCKHCLGDTKEVAFRINTKSTGTRVFSVPSESWMVHPTEDIAISPLLSGHISSNPSKEEIISLTELEVAPLSKAETASKSQKRKLGFYESNPVSIIGFPTGMIEGGTKNYPVVRSATIAQIQGYLDDDPDHPRFLLDGSGFGGNSGGPVVVPKGTWNPSAEPHSRLSNTILIGMVSASMHAIAFDRQNEPTEIVENADLIAVVPLDSINELIHLHYSERGENES